MTCWITEKERYEGIYQLLLVLKCTDYSTLSICSDLMAPVLGFMPCCESKILTTSLHLGVK